MPGRRIFTRTPTPEQLAAARKLYVPRGRVVSKICDGCPFRPDGTGFAVEHPDYPAILASVMSGVTFYCHETVIKDPRTTCIGRGLERRPDPQHQEHFAECRGAILARRGEIEPPAPPTRVVNYRSDAYDVRVMRPSKWGNVFQIGRDGDRATVVARHRAYLLDHPEIIEAAKRELRGKRLGCCCKRPGIEVACHGDNLADAADGRLDAELSARQGEK